MDFNNFKSFENQDTKTIWFSDDVPKAMIPNRLLTDPVEAMDTFMKVLLMDFLTQCILRKSKRIISCSDEWNTIILQMYSVLRLDFVIEGRRYIMDQAGVV